MPVWHASISASIQGRLIPCERYTKVLLQEAVRRASQLLDGVGEGILRRELLSVAVHVRKKLSEKEFWGLPESWRLIPGRDMAGDGTPITEEDLR